MNARIAECRGAPRDLGRDLGCALRAEVRASVSQHGTLRGLVASFRERRATTRLHRDLRRYFPHQSEWLEGLALGSGIAMRVLVRALAHSCAPGTPQGVAIGAVSGTAVAIAGSVPRDAVWRRVAPEGRFRSLEVSLPAASAPVIGVNEAGLAVAVAEQRSLPGRCAPPLALFARDCLERFDRVEPALDWCLSRPAAPGGSILLADARGELAGVYAGGAERRALRPPSWLVLGDAGLELAKAEPLSAGQLEPALASALAALPGAGPAVIADPIGCRLRAVDGDWVWAAE